MRQPLYTLAFPITSYYYLPGIASPIRYINMNEQDPQSAARRSSCIIMALLLACLSATGNGADTLTSDSTPTDLAQYFGFGPMEILKLQHGLGAPIVADLNNDGLNDIVVINNRKARIELLLQKRNFQPTRDIPLQIEDDDINDIFGKERSWRFKRFSYPLDVAAYSLVVADLNNDDRLDLAFSAKDGLRIALQQIPQAEKDSDDTLLSDTSDSATLRQPTWLPAKRIDIREGLATGRALVSGDLNSDALTDLVLLATDGVFMLLQGNDGVMAPPIKYHSASNKLKQVNVADINGDGLQDLVLLTAEHEEFPVRIRFQTPDGLFGPETRYHLPVPAVLETASIGNSARQYLFTVSRQSGRVLISLFPSKPQSENFPVYTYPLAATEKAEHRDMVSADIDGDGLLDVIVSDPTRAEFLLFRAKPDTSLATPEHYPGLKDMRKLCSGKLDDSPKDTLVVLSFEEELIALSRFQNGRLSFPESVPISGEPQAMDVADINGDRQLDLVYVSKEKDKDQNRDRFFLRTVLSLGQTNAEDGPDLELTEIKDKPLDLRAADIDHDGRTDVMIIRPYEPLLLVRQKAPSVFEQELSQDIHAGLVSKVYPNALSFARLGPEDRNAALLVRKNFARALIFDPTHGWQVIDQYQAAHPQSNLTTALACRLAPEGPMNIVTYDSARQKLAILYQQPDGTYRTTQQIDVGSIAAKKILAGNFGGPAPISLLLCGNEKLIRIPISDQTYSLHQIADFEPDIKDGRFGELAVGDINSDACPDILLCEQARHHLQILTFDSEALLVNAVKFKVFEQPPGRQESSYELGRQKDAGQPRAVTIGDVTNDGKNDLILLVHDRIIIYPQD